MCLCLYVFVCVSFCAVRVCVSSVESITRRFKRNPGKIPIKQSSGARSRGAVFGGAFAPTLSTLGFAPPLAPQNTLLQDGLQTDNKQMTEVWDQKRRANGSQTDRRRTNNRFEGKMFWGVIRFLCSGKILSQLFK